jgi:hypothetical protein
MITSTQIVHVPRSITVTPESNIGANLQVIGIILRLVSTG